MADGAEPQSRVDGRTARRERNISTALDVVLELFAEGALIPTIEQVSQRSGISHRSLYRYFDDPADLLDAAVRRQRARTIELAHLPAIGEGPVAGRIDAFVAMRLRLYEGVAITYRAAVHNAVHHQVLAELVQANRLEMRAQFEQQFAAELHGLTEARRAAVTAAGDVLTQLDTIDVLRRYRGLSVAEAEEALRTGLSALLA